MPRWGLESQTLFRLKFDPLAGYAEEPGWSSEGESVSVRLLQWVDIDLESETVHRLGEIDKNGLPLFGRANAGEDQRLLSAGA
jgi:hypothetical protein